MRIFLSSQQALRRHAVPSYGFWEYYFKNGLAEAGHEVVEAPGVDWAEGLTRLEPAARQRWLADTWGRTVDTIRVEHASRPIGLFLGYLFPDQVDPAAVAAIHALGVPCVNFFCDNVREFTAVPASYRNFDLHWVPEAGAREMYARAGLPHVYAPMPIWIPPAFRTLPGREVDEVTFLGSHDPLREDLLAKAVGRGLVLRLHGAGWRPDDSPGTPGASADRSARRTLANQVSFLRSHGLRGFLMRATYQLHRPRDRSWIGRCWQPPLEGEDYFRVTRESAVVIGINRYPGFRHSFRNPGLYSRLRDIEAPMLGACYLVERAPGLEDLYDLEQEVATYRTPAELVGQAARLRTDSAWRARLRRQGQRRALADHTLARSLERIAVILGLKT